MTVPCAMGETNLKNSWNVYRIFCSFPKFNKFGFRQHPISQ